MTPRLEAAAALRTNTEAPPVVIGFDGFIDTIAHAVDQRDPRVEVGYKPMRDISALAGRIGAAAGRSTNIELRKLETRAGGNGPLMSLGMARLGCRVRFIGAVGTPDDWTSIDPAYESLTNLAESVSPIASSAKTDALEFDDGKIMFNWSAPLDALDWETLTDRFGTAEIARCFINARMFASVNWTNMPRLESIWKGLSESVAEGDRPDQIFIDISDPAKRSDTELSGMLDSLALLNAISPVTLGLNLAEAERLLDVIGQRRSIDRSPAAFALTASDLQHAIPADTVIVHAREGAAASDGTSTHHCSARRTQKIVLSTGAGDHFNAGYMTALVLGLPIDQAVRCGCDTATHYVSTGHGPSRSELAATLEAHADLE